MFGSSPRTRGTVLRPSASPALVRFIPANAGNRATARKSITWITVHPRERGEQDHLEEAVTLNPGSSPRTRGTGSAQGAISAPIRFIPANAGNREIAQSGRLRNPGSSPRTRGTAGRSNTYGSERRFIPANAGNRSADRWKIRSETVHPRERGEQESEGVELNRDFGSSPRTRGTDSLKQINPHIRRFIPANAGNSRNVTFMSPALPVHPRERGEQGVLYTQ